MNNPVNRLLGYVRDRLARFRSNVRGSTSLEFVISSTLFMFILLWTIETGFIMVRWVMLERGVDLATRELRLIGLPDHLKDNEGNVTDQEAHDYIKSQICVHTDLVKDCEGTLFLELTSIDATNTGVPTTSAQCVNRLNTVDPATDLDINIDLGDRSESNDTNLMYLRACLVVDPYLPANFAMPLPYDESGGVALIVDSAYINEPE